MRTAVLRAPAPKISTVGPIQLIRTNSITIFSIGDIALVSCATFLLS
jgi:hypothetical protein